MDALTAALLRYWGVSTFRPLQREAVVASLEVNDRACSHASCDPFHQPSCKGRKSRVVHEGKGCAGHPADRCREVCHIPAATCVSRGPCSHGRGIPLDLPRQGPGWMLRQKSSQSAYLKSFAHLHTTAHLILVRHVRPCSSHAAEQGSAKECR